MDFLNFDEPLRLAPLCKELDLETGLLFQHHRDEPHRLGVTHRRQSKTGPIQTQWYADYMPHRYFPDFNALKAAATSDSQAIAKTMAAQFAATLQGWPVIKSDDELVGTFKGTRPRCQFSGNAQAARVITLALGWHPLRERVVYLGDKGVKHLRAKGLGETLAVIDSHQ